MRILPLVTALAVSAALYLVVFERPRLMTLVGAPAETAAAAAAPTAATDNAPVAVIAVKSRALPVDRAVLLRGQTEAARKVEIRAETSGRVISAPARRGAGIAADQVLCTLDAGTRPADLAEAEARLAEARINANAATRLQAGGYASDTRAAAATAALQAAEAEVEAAETELARTRIAAPFAGLLETDTAETGSLLTTGGLCATLIDLDPIRLVGYVPETEIDRIALGAGAQARLATGTRIAGRVSFLSRAADPATRTFRVEVEVAATGDGTAIRDGQTAEIVISAPGGLAHLLPASALTLDDDGRLGVRLIDAAGLAAFAPVELLRDTTEGVWLAGLPDTAEVILVGQEYVTDGVAVTPTYRAAQP